jgi:hypothetical protein
MLAEVARLGMEPWSRLYQYQLDGSSAGFIDVQRILFGEWAYPFARTCTSTERFVAHDTETIRLMQSGPKA